MANGRNLLAGRNLLSGQREVSKPFEKTAGLSTQNLISDDQLRRLVSPDPFEEEAQKIGPVQTGAISVGKGLFKIANALGLAGDLDPAEQRALDALEKERPLTTAVGEAVGESLPFLPAGFGTSKIVSTPIRIAASTGVGALEGGLIRRGEGGTESEQIKGAGIGGGIAGAFEAGVPILGRLGGKLIRKVFKRSPKGPLLTKTGIPTEELSDALEASGVSFDDLKDASLEILSKQKQGVVPEQALRASQFEELGIPATKGDITQEFGQQATEARLFESAADTLSEPIRGLRLQQSQGLTGNLETLIQKAGVPENIGTGLKEVLSGRKATLKKQKNALYKAAAKNAEKVGRKTDFKKPIKEYFETETLPDGWFVHGRGKESIESTAPIQFSKDWNVAEGYSNYIGDSGGEASMWMAKPKKTAYIYDFSNNTTKDMDEIVTKAKEDFLDDTLPFASADQGHTIQDVENFVRESFSPNNIVDSAEAFDSPEYYQWFDERFEPDGVLTPDGMVIFRDDGFDLKKVSSSKSGVHELIDDKPGGIGFLPFPTVGIENAIPDQKTISRIARLQGSQTEPILDLIAEFGIDTSEQAAKRLKDKGIQLEQLSLQNFDEFRIALNQIERADQTGASSVIIGPIRDALDNEAENIADVLQKAGVTDENVLGPLKEARNIVRQLKTEFSPQAITGKLIDVKRDGFTPVIEASQAFKNIVGTNKPIELLDRTITSLKKAGPKGIKAIGDIQAATVLDLIESAFKAETRKVQGAKTFGTVAFNKRLAQIGDDKLKLIFSTNPGLLADLKKVSVVASNLTPPSGAVPKGSAGVILDTMNKIGLMTILGKLPGGGLFVEGLTKLSEGQATRKAVSKALDARPELQKTISVIESELPSVAVALGLMGLREEETQ